MSDNLILLLILLGAALVSVGIVALMFAMPLIGASTKSQSGKSV